MQMGHDVENIPTTCSRWTPVQMRCCECSSAPSSIFCRVLINPAPAGGGGSVTFSERVMDGVDQHRVLPCLFQQENPFSPKEADTPLPLQPLNGNNIHEGAAARYSTAFAAPGTPGSLRARTDNKPSCGVHGCQCLSHVSNPWWGFTVMIDSVPRASARVKRRLADSYCTAPQGSGVAAPTGFHVQQSHPK